jgi:predicted enzyme related to lactoylglutathione lyase
MMANRSMAPGAVVPVLGYQDVAKAIEWLCSAFGFTERLRTPAAPDGNIHHAQLAIRGGAAILTGERGAAKSRSDSVLVHVEDVDAHFERAGKFGAKIVRPPSTAEFGERQYTAEDVEGHSWTFSQSVADVRPEDWGAQVSRIQGQLELLPRPRLCYLEIPAVDVHQSAAFYKNVFGWNIRHGDTERPSFDDATGNVSGAWVTGRPTAREPGLLPYIWVDGIAGVLARVRSEGGEVVEPAHQDHPGSSSWIATFHDPAGNLIGLYQESM